jgi:DNA gyrase inhibitor GyrI
MEKFEVKIKTLSPMKAASFYGFGNTPEMDAHQAAKEWLTKQDLIKPQAYRNFGFNNPNPSAGSPNYGYEVWIVPASGLPREHGAKEIEFSGGLYAVAYCPSLDVIGEIWQKLVAWRDSSEYDRASHQWLEELYNPWEFGEDRFDLYLPIKK